MAGYARQSSSSIADGEVITAAPLNSEFDALLAAFAFSGGHNHDGSSTEGAYVGLIADVDALNKIVVDTSNNRHGFFVEVSSSAVEQIRIQDGAIVPVTDSDIDLGTSSLEFKDLYIDGTAYIDTLEIHVGATLSAGVLSLPDGSASAPVITNTGDTNQGLFFSDTDEMSFTAGGTAQVTFADGVIKPATDNDIDLGTSSNEFKNLFLDGTANIDTLAATTMSGDLAMGSNKVTGLAAPTADGDAARKAYVDDSISSAEGLTQLAGNINVNGFHFFGSSGEDIKFKPVGSASLLATQDNDGEFVALVLRNESDAADTTGIASLRFDLEDTGGNTVDAAKIAVKKEQSFTATASTQDAKIVFSTSLNGTLTEYLELNSAGALVPVTDNTVDIGTSSKEIKDIYVDGTAYLDAIGFGSTSMTLPTSDGSANQVLKTDGSGTLSFGSGTTINNATENELVTVASTTSQLDGEANLTFDGTTLTLNGKLAMASNTAGKLLIADGTDFEPTAVGDLAEIGSIANDDVLLAVDASGGGLKKVARSTLVSGLATSSAISNIVEDTTPQLGGDLDAQGKDVTDVGILFADASAGIYGPTGSPVVFTVTVASKTSAHPYNGDGSSSGYFLNGIESPALKLHGADSVTSSTEYFYKFDQADSSNSGHPLRFYLDAAKTIAYTTGVTTSGTPGTAGAHTTIAVTDQTPSTLYYQCSSHAYMGNYASVDSANIASSGAVTIDAVGDITLDADGGDILFKDAGTTFGSATNTSGDLIIKSGTTTALTFSGANATAAGNLSVTGNLTINGTTTTVNSTTVTIDDPIFTLGGDSAPGSDDNKDRGIEFRYHTGSAAKVGFFGYDDSASAFTFIPDATNSSEVFSGTAGNVVFGNIAGTLTTAAQTNITSVGALDGGSITSGFGTINTGSSNITTTGTVSGTNVAGTLTTAAQTNITSTGALDGGSITSGFGAIDNGTSGIRTNTFTAETSIVPDASGGADIGSTSLEWGDLYIADDKKIYLGSDQDVSIEYDEDGNDTTAVVAAGGISFAPHGTGTGNGTELRFQELAANGANYVGFKAPDSISSNEVWVLPNADGSAGEFLKTDGSNNLSWDSPASAGTTTLVADGAISNGQPVVITSAGKATQVSGTNARIGGVGSEAVLYPTGQFNGYANNMSAMVYDPDTDRFIFMTADTADQSQSSTSEHTPISKVLTINADKSISQGTAQRMNSNLNLAQDVYGGGTIGAYSSAYYDTVVNKVYQFIYLSDHGTNNPGVYYTYGTVTGGTTNTISWASMQRVSPSGHTTPTSGDSGHHFAAGTVSGVRYGVWAHKNTTNQHANNGDGSALIGEMDTSSGAMSWNSTAIIIDDSQNGRTLGMDVTFDTSVNKFLIQYTKGEETSSDRDVHLVVATPSGTGSQSTLSLGTPVEMVNAGTFGGEGSQTFLQYDEELQRTVAFFVNDQDSRVHGSVISISGTTPTATTPAQIINENVSEGGISATKNTELSTSSKGIYEVICKTSQNELYMINVEVTTSGVSHSDTLGARKFEIPQSNDADSGHEAHHIAHGSSTSTDASCGILTTFGDGKAPASDYNASWGNTGANQQSRPTAIFRQSDVAFSTNLTTENYIGIADANYSDGDTATVQIAGSIDDAQSSLTIGQIYYVKPTGGLDRVQGLPKVVAGVATSASTLAIAGPPTDPQHDTRIFIGSRDFRREKDENGNSNTATTFMIPANIPASEVVAYEIEIHNVSCSGTTDNIYVYCLPLAADGSTNVMSNTWHAVNAYTLGTSYSDTTYDFTSSTGLPCMLGGKNYGLFNNQQDSVPQVDNTTNDTSSGLYSKCIYTQGRRYASWNWDATWNGDGGSTGGIVSLDKGHASTDSDASTTGFAHGFKIYAANSGGSEQSSIRFTQGLVSVYAIVKSDLDRSGVSATGGNEDFGG